MKSTLPKDYSIKEIPKDEFGKLWIKEAVKMFSDNLDYDDNLMDTKSEKKKLQ